MKKALTLFVFFTLFPLNTFADVVFSPDGKLAATVNSKRVALWDVHADKKFLDSLTRGARTEFISVTFSPDGQTLASGTWKAIDLWDVNSSRHLRTITGYPEWVYSVAFSPDGQTLASGNGDGTIGFWDVQTSKHLRTFSADAIEKIYEIVFSPDGQRLVSRGDNGLGLWDVNSGRLIRTLRYDRIYNIALSPDGQTLVSAHRDHRVRFWDVDTFKRLRTFDAFDVFDVAFSPDGRSIAAGGSDWRTLLLDVNSGREIYEKGTGERVISIAFSPDGQTLAGETWKGSMYFSSLPPTRIYTTPDSIASPAIGEQFTVNVGITNGENVGGYQLGVKYDPTVLLYVESVNGDYLPTEAFFVPGVVSERLKWSDSQRKHVPVENTITLGATSLTGVSNGDGMLATVTFEVLDVKESYAMLSETILTDSHGEPLPHLSYDARIEPSQLLAPSVVSLAPSSMLSPSIGEQFTLEVYIVGGQNIADFHLTFNHDRSALKLISSSRGNYLTGGVGNGDGTLMTVTFEVLNVKVSTVSVSGYFVAPNGLHSIPTFERAKVSAPLFGDVNRDGVVNILDLVKVASSFGQRVGAEGNPADVNEDDVVNIIDLVKVAAGLGADAAAPTAWRRNLEASPTSADVQQWLFQARQLNLMDATSQRGILVLEQLLAALIPKETMLLPNYPNPFNPETWIPYQLAESADVQVTIYDTRGIVVRQLELGHQSAGFYTSRNRAAYWDGKNALGESVASGLYFYTLEAGGFTATQKMLILK